MKELSSYSYFFYYSANDALIYLFRLSGTSQIVILMSTKCLFRHFFELLPAMIILSMRLWTVVSLLRLEHFCWETQPEGACVWTYFFAGAASCGEILGTLYLQALECLVVVRSFGNSCSTFSGFSDNVVGTANVVRGDTGKQLFLYISRVWDWLVGAFIGLDGSRQYLLPSQQVFPWRTWRYLTMWWKKKGILRLKDKIYGKNGRFAFLDFCVKVLFCSRCHLLSYHHRCFHLGFGRTSGSSCC